MRRPVVLLVAVALAAALFAPGPAEAEIDAGSWQVVPAQRTSGQDFIFNAITAPAPDDVWAIGYHWESVGGALEFRTLAEHYEGGQFVVVPTPDIETAPAV